MVKFSKLLIFSFIFIGTFTGCVSKSSQSDSQPSPPTSDIEAKVEPNVDTKKDPTSPPSSTTTIPNLASPPEQPPALKELKPLVPITLIPFETKATSLPQPSVFTVDPSNSAQRKELLFNDVVNTYLDVNNPEEKSTFELLFRLAHETQGQLTLSLHHHSFATTINTILNSLLNRSDKYPISFDNSVERKSDLIDVALVFDTTNSMQNDILNFKQLFPQSLKSKLDLEPSTNLSEVPLRIGIIGYRDRNNQYVAKKYADLTSDSYPLSEAIKQLEAGEGNKDPQEALLDGLETALHKLTWRPNATTRVIILATDSPGHETTINTGKSLDQIILEYQSTSPQIHIYPVLTVTNPYFDPVIHQTN